MSKAKINQAYFDAWSKKINNDNEEALLVISKDDLGNIGLHTINGLSQDKVKELLFALATGLEAQSFLNLIKIK